MRRCLRGKKVFLGGSAEPICKMLLGLFLLALMALSVLPIRGEQIWEHSGEVCESEQWQAFVDALPEQIGDAFEEAGAAGAESVMCAEFWRGVVAEIILGELECCGVYLLAICTVCTIGATISRVCSPSAAGVVTLCTGGGVIAVLAESLERHFLMLETYFEGLDGVMSGVVPMTAYLWAMGGNLTAAASGQGVFMVMLSVVRRLFGGTVIPVCGTIGALSFCRGIGRGFPSERVLGAIKKIYSFFLGLCMTLLTATLACKAALATSADSVAARSAKMISATFIPIVGSGVGETLRSVSSGVGYMKSIVGIGGIAAIALTLLPTAILLLLTRGGLLLAAGYADALGCEGVPALLDGVGEMYGCMLAVTVASAAMFVLGLYVFMDSAVAAA